MLGNVGALVDEGWVGSHVVKGFDAVVVAQVAIHGGLGMVNFASYGGGVFAFEDDFADGLGFMRNG